MSKVLFRRAFKDRRRSFAWWALGLALLGGMYTALFPSLGDLLSQLDEYPEEILKAFGLEGVAQLGTPEGYLQLELFSIMAPISVIVFATVLGVGAIAGAERSGEMELLMANPISRTTVFVQRFAAMLIATVGTGVVFWIVTSIGIPVGVWPDLDNWKLTQALISLVLLGWAFGSLGLGLSGATGNSGLSYSIVGATALGTFVLNSFSKTIDGLDPAKWASPFHYYLGSSPLTDGINWWHTLVPLAITAVAFVVGLYMFNRRDLKQPGG